MTLTLRYPAAAPDGALVREGFGQASVTNSCAGTDCPGPG